MLREIASLLIAACIALPAEAEPGLQNKVAEIESEIAPLLQPGDLIFKGASTAVWTELAARWSTGDKRWGHVGIVTRVPEICCEPILVVHADTGTGDPDHVAAPGEVIGEVRAVPLSQFLADVDQIGVFRLEMDTEGMARLVEYAASAAVAHIPFDRGYSLDSPNNLYCTELVWRAMSAGLGHDAIAEKSRSMGRVYVALSDLSLHPRARQIADFDFTESPDH